MVDRLKRIVHDADAWLIRHRWTRIGRRAVGGFLEHESLQNAGSMAYFSILSVFQLLVLGVVAMSFFLGEGEGRDFVVEQIQASTPMDPDTVVAIIDGVIESRGGIGLISGAFLLWGALGVFSALNRGISSAFVSTERRGFLQDKLVGLALMAVTGLLGIGSIAIGIVTGVLQRAADDVLATIPGGGLAVWLIGMLTPIVLIFLAFLAIYRLVPNRKVTLAEVWPGAVVATLLWTILRVGFTWYTTNVANYDSAFGPIAAAISLLVFLYFASVIVLLGAEVARASVLDDPRKLPLAVFADAVAPPAPAQPPEAQPAITPPTDERVRVPGWAMAVGGAAAAAFVRWLSSRRR
jgi:membrane protein